MQIEPEQYNNFINNLQLLDIELKNLNAKKIIDDLTGMESSVSLNYKDTEYKYENGLLTCSPVLKLRFKDLKTKKLQLSVDVNYEIRYRYTQDEGISEEIIEFFIRRTIKNVIWPYLRETINSTTSKMGLNDFVLPVGVTNR